MRRSSLRLRWSAATRLQALLFQEMRSFLASFSLRIVLCSINKYSSLIPFARFPATAWEFFPINVATARRQVPYGSCMGHTP